MGNNVSGIFYNTSYEYIKELINFTPNPQNIQNTSSNNTEDEVKKTIEKENKINIFDKSKESEYEYEEINIIQNILVNYNNGSLSKENILIIINDYIEMNTNINNPNRNFKIIKKFAKQFEDGIYDKFH